MDSGSSIPLITTLVMVGLTVGMAYRIYGGVVTSTAATDGRATFTSFLGRQKQHYGYQHYMQIPTPRYALPFFGHIPLLGSSVALKIYQWHQTYGSLLRLRMGSQNWLLIADPYFAHELFAKHDNQPMTRPYHRFVDEYYSKQRRGLVYSSADNDKYQDFRCAVLQYLSPESIDEQLIDYEVDSFIERVLEKANKCGNRCLDPFCDLKLTCINIFMSVAFAKRYDSTDDPDFIDGEGILDECFPLLGVAGDPGSFVSLLRWIPWVAKSNNYMNKSMQRRDAFFKRFIERSLNEATSHCLVKTLYSIRDKYQLDYDDILVTLSDMNGMASDLPPTSLTWSLAILSNHVDVQDRMRQEIAKFYQQHKRLPQYSERHHFPFLLSVQKECLRYRCSNSFSVPRQFEADVTCYGIVIPKHTVCVCPFYAMHMNESFYEQSTVFNPDRFYNPSTTYSILDTTNADVEDRDVFLFGFGPRRCPGLHMVERHMFSLFVRLFYHCRIQNPLDEDGNRIKLDLNGSSDYGVMLRPLPFTIQVIDLLSSVQDDDNSGNSGSDDASDSLADRFSDSDGYDDDDDDDDDDDSLLTL